MHRMTVNSSEHLCGGLNAKSAPDKWLRAPTGSGSVGPKYAERSKNTKKLRRVGYWCLERTHAHQRGLNTTPSLCHSTAFDAMAYDWGWFTRMRLVNSRDRSNWVSHPECRIDHALSSPLVITVFFRYLLHANAKSSSRNPMVIILPHPVSRCDICSRSNARNWTSCNEMPCAATFPAVS